MPEDTYWEKVKTGLFLHIGKKMAPALGFEPRTKWLTATYSTAELCRNASMLLNIVRKKEMSS